MRLLGVRETWRAQRPLTERWTLVAPDRPGHGQSPPARQDFEPEAALIADQLLDEPSRRPPVWRGERDHLVPEAPEFNALLESFLTSTS